MPHEISRRGFIALGMGAVAWACGRGPAPKAPSSAARGPLSVSQVVTEMAVGDHRLTFATFNSDKTPFDPGPGARVTARLAGPAGTQLPPITAADQTITLGRGGDQNPDRPEEGAEVHHIFAVDHMFTDIGFWTMNVSVAGRSGRMAFQVVDKSSTVMIGGKAIASQSPTVSDPKGVNPICTRTPPCTMHDMTIAQALAAGKPSALVFATPKFCTSRTCGPLVDIVQKVKGEVGAAASFVHIEIYRDEQAQQTSPTVDEWGIPTDPWIFFVGPDGVVKDRWSGAAGFEETRKAVQDLVAGRL